MVTGRCSCWLKPCSQGAVRKFGDGPLSAHPRVDRSLLGVCCFGPPIDRLDAPTDDFFVLLESLVLRLRRRTVAVVLLLRKATSSL